MQVASRIAAWQSGKKLPYKRRLAYLESTGTQYIDTGIIPNADGFGFDVEFLATKYTNSNSAILGVRNNATNNASWYYIQAASSRQLRLPILGSYGITQSIPAITQNSVEISYRPTELIVNGTSYAVSGKGECDYSFWLFTFNNGGSPFTPLICYRLPWFKAYDKDTLIQSLIPVMDFNDVPCMYDEVSGECFYNQGTGAFLYGELDGGGGYKCIRRFSSRSTRRLRSFRAMRSRNLWKEVA